MNNTTHANLLLCVKMLIESVRISDVLFHCYNDYFYSKKIINSNYLTEYNYRDWTSIIMHYRGVA